MIALFVPKKKLKEGLTCIKKVARLNFAAVIIEIYKKKKNSLIYTDIILLILNIEIILIPCIICRCFDFNKWFSGGAIHLKHLVQPTLLNSWKSHRHTEPSNNTACLSLCALRVFRLYYAWIYLHGYIQGKRVYCQWQCSFQYDGKQSLFTWFIHIYRIYIYIYLIICSLCTQFESWNPFVNCKARKSHFWNWKTQ